MSQKIEFFPWYKITTWHSPPFVCLRDNKKPIPYWAIGMAVCQLPCCIDRLQRCHVLVAQFNVPSIFTLSADFPCPLSDAYHIMDPGLGSISSPGDGCSLQCSEDPFPPCRLKCHQQNWKNSPTYVCNIYIYI